MIFLRAGGQWLFEKPASLSPSLLPSLSLALSLLHLSVFPHLPLPLPPFSPRSTVPHPPTTTPPESRHRAGCDNGNIPLSASRFSR